MNTLDSLITAASLILFPLFVGSLCSVLTLATTRNKRKSLEEGIKVTLVFWAVMVIGALIYGIYHS